MACRWLPTRPMTFTSRKTNPMDGYQSPEANRACHRASWTKLRQPSYSSSPTLGDASYFGGGARLSASPYNWAATVSRYRFHALPDIPAGVRRRDQLSPRCRSASLTFCGPGSVALPGVGITGSTDSAVLPATDGVVQRQMGGTSCINCPSGGTFRQGLAPPNQFRGWRLTPELWRLR